MATERYSVWKGYFGTYAEIAVQGDRKPELIEKGLTLDLAKQKCEELGSGDNYGHYFYPDA